jgi:hypothetical protein
MQKPQALTGFWEPIGCLEKGASKLLSFFNPLSFLMQNHSMDVDSTYQRNRGTSSAVATQRRITRQL